MSQDELRLELLKLTYTHGREASEAVSRAKELEVYVLAKNPEPVAAQTSGRLGLPKREPKGRETTG